MQENWKKGAMLLLALALGVKAQDPSLESPQADGNSLKASYDRLFEDIMHSLPAEARSQVDTVMGRGATLPETRPTAGDADRETIVQEKRSAALEKLPAELRSKVEKALADLDNRRRERELEFKELAPKAD